MLSQRKQPRQKSRNRKTSGMIASIKRMLTKSNSLLGLDIGSSSIKVANLRQDKTGYVMSDFGMIETPADSITGGEIVQPIAVSEAVKGLVADCKIKMKSVATNIWGSAVIVKKITMPRMEVGLVAEQIKWEAEQYIPFDINEICLEYHVLRGVTQSSETMDVLLVAAKREFVLNYASAIKSSGLRCEVLDVSSFALANCFEYNYGRLTESVALLNFGARVTNFVMMEQGEVVFCRDIPVGGINYSNDIHKELGVSVKEAESLKMSAVMGQAVPVEVSNVLKSTSDVIADEIQNSFDFYLATADHSGISKIYVSGGSARVPGLVDHISNTTKVGHELLNPFQKVRYDQKKFSEDYIAQIQPYAALAVGLALRSGG